MFPKRFGTKARSHLYRPSHPHTIPVLEPKVPGTESKVSEGKHSMDFDRRQGGFVEKDHSDLGDLYEDDELVDDNDHLSCQVCLNISSLFQLYYHLEGINDTGNSIPVYS